MEKVLFILFAGGAILSAIAVILPVMARTPVHSALALVVTFLCLAGLYALLAAHVLAVLQILVYAGAIMVLFLFVIMLLNLGQERTGPPKRATSRVLTSAVAIALVLLLTGQIFGALGTSVGFKTNPAVMAGSTGPDQCVASCLTREVATHPKKDARKICQTECWESFGSLRSVGRTLFSDYLVPFELLSILLLIALPGALILAKKNLDLPGSSETQLSEGNES
ncbi:MAG: hypothetical protein CMH54_01535 [Myxococcales bacterium]|nr:hypothetical protein [Myxococcales bacterium]